MVIGRSSTITTAVVSSDRTKIAEKVVRAVLHNEHPVDADWCVISSWSP